MTDYSDTAIVDIRNRLADRAYDAWRRAESESERFLQTWFAATGAGEAPAYLAYRAALDREEEAALALAPHRAVTPAALPRLRALVFTA